MAEKSPRVAEIIDVHAHVYPEGCFTEVLKDRSDFKLIENPRGQSLLCRGSHVMSMPEDGCLRRRRLSTPIGVGRKSSSSKFTLMCRPPCPRLPVATGRGPPQPHHQSSIAPCLPRPGLSG